MKKPKFEVFKSICDGQWYWHLKSPNGKIICQSEGYKRKANAVKGVESVVENAPVAVIVFE